MLDGLLELNGTKIWHDVQGKIDGEAVIMIPGARARAEQFGIDWCSPLIKAGYRIIRLDNRDVGRSEWIDFDLTPYTLETMAEDIVALMDHLSISAAHLIGNSVGGMIAQLVTIIQPERVLSLTCQASGPIFLRSTEDLSSFKTKEVSDLEERVLHRLTIARALTGKWPFDELAHRKAILDQLVVAENLANHHEQVALATPDQSAKLAKVNTPTLWINGKEDLLFPFDLTESTAAVMPNAQLLALDQVGHLLPSVLIPYVLTFVLEHLKAPSFANIWPQNTTNYL